MTEIKKLKTTENVIEEEVSPQVYFGTGSPFAQSVVLCHIFENHFNLLEQIEMRRVCRLWHYNVKHIWNKEQKLVLTVKNVSMKPSLAPNLNKPKPSYEGNQFYSLQMAKGFKLTIGKDHWNRAKIDLLGDLFRNIQHLTIYYEVPCWLVDPNCDLCYFLQKFPNVKSFSLVMPPTLNDGNASEEFLSKLFKMINDHLAPLHSLHLYLPNYKTPYSAVDIEHFNKTLPYLQNFSFNSTVENLSEILQCMGKSLPARWPIQSLSINVGYDKLLSPVESLFKLNQNLSYMKRLELTSVNTGSLNIVSRLLDHFTQLECLNLCKCPYSSTIKFTFDWIKTLSKLPRLKELYLWNFQIQIFNGWSNKGLKESLPNIRKLAITVWHLSRSVEHQYYKMNNLSGPQDVEPKSMYGLFLHNLAKQFPKLEHLTLNFIHENFDENFSDWCYAEFKHLKCLMLNGRKQ